MTPYAQGALVGAHQLGPGDVVPEPTPLIAPLEPSPEFPIEALGPVLRPAVEAIQFKTQAPTALVAQSVLAAASFVAQAVADVEMIQGTKSPLSGFFLTVARSGERKSTVDKFATRPILERERELARDVASDMAAYDFTSAAYDALRKKTLSDTKTFSNPDHMADALKDLGPVPTPPLSSVLLASEPTLEGLIKTFQFGQPSLGLFSAEGGQFMNGIAMSDDHRNKTAGGLNLMWDADPIRRVRSGDGTSVMYGRRLSLHLMAQPLVASEFMSSADLDDLGFLARCLVVFPQSTIGSRLYRETPAGVDGAIEAYTQGMLAILRRPLPLAPDTRNELDPPTLRINQAARDLCVRHYNLIEGQQRAGESLEQLTAFGSKVVEHACRLAGVLAVVADQGHISELEMACGIELSNFYTREAMRLFAQASIPQEIKDAEDLRCWIVDRPRLEVISTNYLMQFAPARFRQASVIKKLCAVLCTHGHLTPIDGGAVIDGKMYRHAFQVWRK